MEGFKEKKGRIMVDWTDTVPKSAVILFDFQLTATNRLHEKGYNPTSKRDL